jgi:hypothetical protein
MRLRHQGLGTNWNRQSSKRSDANKSSDQKCGERGVASPAVKARYAQIRTMKEILTRLTICNRKPPILLLHLKLAMMSLRVVVVLVHMLLFFTRLHLGVEFWFFRRRGRRHGYEWFGYVQQILGLGVNACVSRALLSDHVRSRCQCATAVPDSAESAAPKEGQGCIGWVRTASQ